jgi:uncharacterized protein (TIGR02147 family)
MIKLHLRSDGAARWRPAETTMPNIFKYTNFRDYLADLYKEKKSENNPGFSYERLAQRSGLNKGFIYGIFTGKKRMSPIHGLKLALALGLNKQETEYFENLAAFNQTDGLAEKKHFFEKMTHVAARSRNNATAQIVNKNQYEFYSKWYYSAVRSLVGIYGFSGDYKRLARLVMPRITISQARKSITLLINLGMIAKRRDGSYRITDKSITTGKEVMGLAVRNFHFECAELAKRSIRDLSKNERNITGLTLGISNAAYRRICEETLAFQESVMNIANNDPDADRVYQFNFHLFPLSKPDHERKRP